MAIWNFIKIISIKNKFDVINHNKCAITLHVIKKKINIEICLFSNDNNNYNRLKWLDIIVGTSLPLH